MYVLFQLIRRGFTRHSPEAFRLRPASFPPPPLLHESPHLYRFIPVWTLLVGNYDELCRGQQPLLEGITASLSHAVHTQYNAQCWCLIPALLLLSGANGHHGRTNGKENGKTRTRNSPMLFRALAKSHRQVACTCPTCSWRLFFAA